MEAMNGTRMVTCDAGSDALSRLKRMSDAEFASATHGSVDLSQFPIDALAYIANRSCRLIGGRPVVRTNSRKDCAAYVVYWIVFKATPAIPLYVGITKNLDIRWREHRSTSKELASIKDRGLITIRVVDTVVGTLADAEAVEVKQIQYAAELNASLINRRRN
jgi:predicted GIY-YIG superfamily endonuclease